MAAAKTNFWILASASLMTREAVDLVLEGTAAVLRK